MKRIEYTYKQEVGPYGVKFIKDVPAHITKGGNKKRRAIFLCPFCGTLFTSCIDAIILGRTRSCGCYNRKVVTERNTINITGQRFGKLVAIKSTGIKDTKSGCFLWGFHCDCGRTKIIPCGWVTCGNTSSCGCSKSKGEDKIANILDSIPIKYIRQYSFSDCQNKEHTRRLYFDFYLSDLKILIEYDGEQHFFVTGRHWNNKENTYKTQERDKIKDNYCLEHNIVLVRIKYTSFYKLDKEFLLDLFSQAEQKGEGIIYG